MKIKKIILLISIFFTQFYPIIQTFYVEDILQELKNKDFISILQTLIQLGNHIMPEIDDQDSEIFDIFPQYLTQITPYNGKVELKLHCFQNLTVQAFKLKNGDVKLEMQFKEPINFMCSDHLLIATMNQFHSKQYLFQGQKELIFNFPKEESLQYDLYERGIRIFNYRNCPIQLFKNIIKTSWLFTPFAFLKVNDKIAEQNLKFLKQYVGIDMKPRTIINVDIEEDLIQNGDTFHIQRLDGVDPVISWSMGSATGHVAIAIRRENKLMICESQAKSPYWPINGVQCNEYKEWIRMAREADYNFVWAPIDRSLDFDLDKANKFIDSMIGVDYGFEVLLVSLIDDIKGNFPCMQNDVCLPFEFLEILFPTLERYIPLATRTWKQAMNNRINTTNLPIHEVYYQAQKLGINTTILPTIPEQDGWLYQTTKYDKEVQSPVMICQVFACSVLKHAGIFKNYNINCAEFSVWDLYKIKIYEENFQKPIQCIKADPENPICQLGGKYTLRLDNQPGITKKYNFVKIYDNMNERCSSNHPNYKQPDNC